MGGLQQSGRLSGIATRPRPGDAMAEQTRCEITASGIAGERRFGRARQITLLSAAQWREVCAELGAQLPWTARRANLLVEGVPLANSVGRRIRCGAALLEVVCETDPCEQMDAAHPGLRAALLPEWRGGVSVRVLRGGAVQTGDAVAFAD